MKNIRVAELFAGVGGFRLGLTKASKDYNIVWSNQWEPSTKKQDASDIYIKNFGAENHSNEDISKVPISSIPDHDLLAGGFPCQDYSVARTLNQASGIEGKKGVLWWEIYRILIEKKTHKPQFLFLENVDRLLKSPASQRGRDFAIMLASLSDLGYIVEWRVINAADYGMPQRRRRIFILGYLKNSSIFKNIRKIKEPIDWVLKTGVIAETFKVSPDKENTISKFTLEGTLAELTLRFNKEKAKESPFKNSGIMISREIFSIETKAIYTGTKTILGDIILLNGKVPDQYYIGENNLEKWQYLKGAKKEKRTDKKTGFEYSYNEGPMIFPDSLDKPSRTIITAEGGASPSRFKHVIKTKDSKFRRLTPVELERLNMFPDNHTEGASDIKRAFFMGNALVVGVIEKIAKSLIKKIGE
jgi:DNA (cytosine-5)-methyltransferase 1